MRPDSTYPTKLSRKLTHLTHGFQVIQCLLIVAVTLFAFEGASARGQVVEATSDGASADFFRMERVPVAGGADLVTVFAKLGGLQTAEDEQWVPLVSILRDTLEDASSENDRLRYVWPLTYTRPTFKQRVLGAIPSLYTRCSRFQPRRQSRFILPHLNSLDVHDCWGREDRDTSWHNR